jgi:hypothetical protein
MRSRDVKKPLTVRRASYPARSADTTEQVGQHSSRPQNDWHCEQPGQPPEASPYSPISTERIMRAVEQQRRITQELDDLCTKQKQRVAILRKTGFKLLLGVNFLLTGLIIVLVVLSLTRPSVLVQLLAKLNDTMALLVAVEEGIKTTLSLIPSNSWLLSGVALAIVLMMGMWLRLMRHPREA